MAKIGNTAAQRPLPGKLVLVLQGGGAMGAYQVGVIEALEEAGLRPDWVIGTSIGAINGAIVAGNPLERRLDQLDRFWSGLARGSWTDTLGWWPELAATFSRLGAVTWGVPGFFTPRFPFGTPDTAVDPEQVGFYAADALRETLRDLIDEDLLNAKAPRFTVGAVVVRDGRMRYFDTRDERLSLQHILASGALPPAFPPVRIDGALYWDGGVCSNTPIEAVFDDAKRHSAVVFAVQLWPTQGEDPISIRQALARQKDIQYASRVETHITRQAELHHLRHIIRELERRLPSKLREDEEVKALTAYGCATTVHVVRLVVPPMDSDDAMKDIDFRVSRVAELRRTGLEAARRMIAREPWRTEIDPAVGVAIHDDDPGENGGAHKA